MTSSTPAIRRTWSRWRVVAVFVIAASCDVGIADGSYRGEPLAVLKGQVLDGSDGLGRGKVLRAALVWWGAPVNNWSAPAVVTHEVAISGALPSSFEIPIYEPPPDCIMSAHPLSADNRTVFGTVVVYMDRDSDGKLDLPSYRHLSSYGDPLGAADAILGMRNDMMIFYNEGPAVQMHVGELVSPELPSGFGMVSTPFLNARMECKYQHADDTSGYEDCVREIEEQPLAWGFEKTVDLLVDDAPEPPRLVCSDRSEWPCLTRCWTTRATRPDALSILEVDVATGTLVEVHRIDASFSEGMVLHGLTRLGERLLGSAFHCGSALHCLVEIDMSSRTLEIDDLPEGQVGPVSVTSDESRYVAACPGGWPPNQLCRYQSREDIVANHPADNDDDYYYRQIRPRERMTIHDGQLYGSTSQAREVQVVDLPPGDEARTIILEGYDTWVDGMSVAGGVLYLLSGNAESGRRNQRVVRFDSVTGAWLGEVSIGHTQWGGGGLWCF